MAWLVSRTCTRSEDERSVAIKILPVHLSTEKGALPLEKVLRYGIEIAGALDRAHRGD